MVRLLAVPSRNLRYGGVQFIEFIWSTRNQRTSWLGPGEKVRGPLSIFKSTTFGGLEIEVSGAHIYPSAVIVFFASNLLSRLQALCECPLLVAMCEVALFEVAICEVAICEVALCEGSFCVIVPKTSCADFFCMRERYNSPYYHCLLGHANKQHLVLNTELGIRLQI